MKRERFVAEKIKADAEGRSATSAAIAAGYAESGAAQEAYRLLRNAEIQERIERAKSRASVTPEEIIGSIAEKMHGDIADLLNEKGEFDYALACKRRVTGQIKKLKIKDRKLIGDEEQFGVETTYELELYSALDAAKSLADIYGLKQQPRENEQDAKRKREWAEGQLQRVMEQGGMNRDAAIQWMREHTPSAAVWIN